MSNVHLMMENLSESQSSKRLDLVNGIIMDHGWEEFIELMYFITRIRFFSSWMNDRWGQTAINSTAIKAIQTWRGPLKAGQTGVIATHVESSAETHSTWKKRSRYRLIEFVFDRRAPLLQQMNGAKCSKQIKIKAHILLLCVNAGSHESCSMDRA